MPHYSHSTGEKPIRSWHGDTDARRREEADQRRPADEQQLAVKQHPGTQLRASTIRTDAKYDYDLDDAEEMLNRINVPDPLGTEGLSEIATLRDVCRSLIRQVRANIGEQHAEQGEDEPKPTGRGRRFPSQPLDPQFCWNLESDLGKFRDYSRISLTERKAVDQTIAIVRHTRYARPEGEEDSA